MSGQPIIQGEDPAGSSEADNISAVRREVYRFLKHGMVAGRTCDYDAELAKDRGDAIRLFGSNGKSFVLIVSR